MATFILSLFTFSFLTAIGAFIMASVLTFYHSDDKPDETMLLVQYFLSTILLPVKDLLISISFSYLYFYQASNLNRKNRKKKDIGKKNN